MSHASLKEQIVAGLALTKAATADGKVTLKEGIGIFAEVLHAAAVAAGNLTDPVAGKEQLIQAAEQVYDEYVAPIDLTSVPNFIEKHLDKWLRDVIRPSISALVDRIGA